jgi:transcriptional regulator with XRE-family HTH domain
MLNTKIIGNRITEARKKINISQAQLAEQLFISSQAVGKWERGESMPDIITLNRLGEILGVDLNYFSANPESTSFEPIKDRVTSFEHDSARETEVAQAAKTLKWDMSRGNWVDADFSGLKNLNEKFSSSNMLRCKFIGSDLSGLLLSGNNINGCDFSESDLNGSHIKGSHLQNNQFTDCSLGDTEFSGSHVSPEWFLNPAALRKTHSKMLCGTAVLLMPCILLTLFSKGTSRTAVLRTVPLKG